MMDTAEEAEEFFDCPEIARFEDYDHNWAKEKASLLWLLSKAFHGEIPGDLKEPFYRDQDNVRRLKPKIVHSLANGELYCLALVHIYNDPNYHNLHHHGIIQALMRKGICLVESRDSPLTETVLVQTAPIRMKAHMAVIDGIMSLYIKEILIPEKVVEVVREFMPVDPQSEMPSNPEEAAVLWINKCCKALEKEIRAEYSPEEQSKLPKLPVIQEIADVSDGCCLAAVIHYYCPNYLKWQDICFNDPMSIGDSIYNLQMVKKFCHDCLPSNINFLTIEDLLYVQSCIRENVLAFVADLLYMFVIWKVNCVTRSRKVLRLESSHNPLETSKSLTNFQSHKSQVPCSPIPNLRSDSYGGSTTSLPDSRIGNRSKICGSREKLEKASNPRKTSLQHEDAGLNDLQRASSVGMVNGWKASNTSLTDSGTSSPKQNILGGHRVVVEAVSSCSDLSHKSSDVKTSEFLARCSPLREVYRKSSDNLRHGHHQPTSEDLSNGTHEPKSASRKSLEDYYKKLVCSEGPLRSVSASNVVMDGKTWKNPRKDKFSPKSQEGESIPESTSSHSSGICLSDVDAKNQFSTTSFAELSKLKKSDSNSINIVYVQQQQQLKHEASKNLEGKKTTTFASLPNTTTWQQQYAANTGSPQTDSGHETPTDPADSLLNAQLRNVRLQLEEKKRKIELKKKRMEILWKKQKQKICKAVFLQAVGRGKEASTPDAEKDVSETEPSPTKVVQSPQPQNASTMVKRMSMQEIAEDLDVVQKKWFESDHSPLPANVESEADDGGGDANIDFQTSIQNLNTSLTDLEADISRISLQQEQVESLMKDSVEDESHFFLHNQSPKDTGSLPHWDESRNLFTPPFYDNRTKQHTPELPRDEIKSEELYSKVVKPENRAKPHDVQGSISSPIKAQNGESKPTNIHVVIPHISEQAHEDKSNRRKKDIDGFYVPFDKEPKKHKHKSSKSIKCDTDSSAVPKSSARSANPSVNVPEDTGSFGFVIGADLVHPDPEAESEMARKKEMIMHMSIQRKAEYERKRAEKEHEYARMKEEEQRKQEYLERKRDEEKRRREAILDQYRHRKLQEELEKEGSIHKEFYGIGKLSSKPKMRREAKPRPRSAFVAANTDLSTLASMDHNLANKRNSQLIYSGDAELREFDVDSLNSASTSASSHDHHPRSPRNEPMPLKSASNLQIPELVATSSDGASDTASNGSSADYTGPKLFVKPTAKSNRGIVNNAVNTVLAGKVNADTKTKVLEELNRSESKHFLILFRDAGCQFRGLYSYCPEREEVTKLFGIGPKNITERMIDRFYKYNSGGKCFSEIQTKHLTVTIDAFTIANSLWAGKRVIPPKKEFF